MVDKISPHDEYSADEKLVTAIGQALDESLDEIDDLSAQRLRTARVRALNSSAKSSRKWVPLSMAASVAALLLIPIVYHQYPFTDAIDPESDIVLHEIPYSAEELDDMEMLMSLGEPDV